MGIFKPGRSSKYRPGGNKPPPNPGLYNIRDAKGAIIYTGETNNLQRRAGEHERGGLLGQGHSYEYKEADGRSTSRTRREYEQKRIAENDPPRNQSGGGEGRPAE
ncbi:MAG: GIY-YIG nuclease family protein [Defluviitaleaceae bacterium]|nr:GIY-YIG nuclease family protein [Defluviitaleaceae bacterium]